MAILDFDSKEISVASNSHELIPAGWYNAVIVESDLKTTKDGSGKYLQLCFEIIDGEYKNRKVWTNLNLYNRNEATVKMAQNALALICGAVGVVVVHDSEELHNIPLSIKIKSREKASGDMVNDVAGYRKRP